MRGMKADGDQGGQLWKDCTREVTVAAMEGDSLVVAEEKGKLQ